MRSGLPLGLKYSQSIVVTSGMTAETISKLFRVEGFVPVLATAGMIVFMELTCAAAVKPFLDDGEETVGTRVDMSHIAATPVGMRVTAEVELIEIQDRKLRFKVLCRDEQDVIGEGFHERGVIYGPKFRARLEAKSLAAKGVKA